jgi:hypothetical protein
VSTIIAIKAAGIANIDKNISMTIACFIMRLALAMLSMLLQTLRRH